MKSEDTAAYKHGYENGLNGRPVLALDGVWKYARTWTDNTNYTKGFEAGKLAKIEEMNK
jgi:hypothetical protein